MRISLAFCSSSTTKTVLGSFSRTCSSSPPIGTLTTFGMVFTTMHHTQTYLEQLHFRVFQVNPDLEQPALIGNGLNISQLALEHRSRIESTVTPASTPSVTAFFTFSFPTSMSEMKASRRILL